MRALPERIRHAAEDWRERHPRSGAAGTLVVRTAKSVARVRIVGLAAESAFFSLLSLPALLLGIIGTLGHLSGILGRQTVLDIRAWVLDLAATVLTADTVATVVTPMVDDFLRGAQGGALSLTFLISLWSGSLAMSVFIESITIAYGLEDMRGFLRQRALAFLAYLGGLLFALLVLPAVVAGPDLIRSLLPFAGDHLHLAYWPVVGVLTLVCITALYMLSVPVRTPLWRHLPGALLAMLILLLGSVGLRIYLDASFGQTSIYGSLTAPIAILAWLYVMALAVLVGSSLNAEIDALWPVPATAEARAAIAARRHDHAIRLMAHREQALWVLAEQEAREAAEAARRHARAAEKPEKPGKPKKQSAAPETKKTGEPLAPPAQSAGRPPVTEPQPTEPPDIPASRSGE